jgi:hypothetical protein
MTIEFKNTLMRFTLGVLLIIFGFTCLVAFFILGPRLETVLNPVVVNFKITEIQAEPGKTEIRGVLNKLRGNCEIEEVNIYAASPEEGPNAKFVISDFSRNVEVRNRPAGTQEWGPWILYPPEKPIGPIITISSLHHCHNLWSVRTDLWSGLTSEVFPFDYK